MVEQLTQEDPIGRRMSIQQELMNIAQYYLSIKHQIPVVHEEKDRNVVIRQNWNGDTPITIVEILAENIPPEKFIQLFQHFDEQMPEYTEGTRTIRLAEEGNCFKIVHQRIEMPMLIQNRSFFNCYYEIDGPEAGEYTFIVSSCGNEYYSQKFKKVAKKDVIGSMNLNYHSVRPIVNHHGDVVGSKLQQVISMHLGGSLLEMQRTQISKTHARRTAKMLDYLRNRPFCMCYKHVAISYEMTKDNMDMLQQLELVNQFKDPQKDEQEKNQQKRVSKALQEIKEGGRSQMVSMSMSPTNIAVVRMNSKGKPQKEEQDVLLRIRNVLNEPPKAVQSPEKFINQNRLKETEEEFKQQSRKFPQPINIVRRPTSTIQIQDDSKVKQIVDQNLQQQEKKPQPKNLQEEKALLNENTQKPSKGQRARTIQVPKNMRDQLKKEIMATLNKNELEPTFGGIVESDKNENNVEKDQLKSQKNQQDDEEIELRLKPVSEFQIQNYRAQKSIGLSRVKSSQMFEYTPKGLVTMKGSGQKP